MVLIIHFEVRTPNDGVFTHTPVDPYGYDPLPESVYQEPPWKHTQPNSLWEVLPDTSLGSSIYPSGTGNALPLPAGPRGGVLVDDYAHLPDNNAPNFETLGDCWQESGQKDLKDAENGYNLYANAVIGNENDVGTCFARWYLPDDQPTGEYAVYVHIPRVLSSPLADGTVYRVFGAGAEIAKLIVSQYEINLRILGSEMGSEDLVVEEGWIYIGSYHFDQGLENYIQLSNMVVGETYNNDGGLVQDPDVAADAVQFVPVDRPTTNVDVALIIDSSGSMSWNDPQDRRKDAGKSYVNNSLLDDFVAVVDFDHTVRVASPLKRIPDEKDALIAAIDTIDSSGGTDIGIGVQKGCEVLHLSDYEFINKGAILLTDGEGSFLNEDQCFKDEGWPIFTFGFGDANEALLQQIAFNTGGQYKHIDNLTSLLCEFIRVRGLIAGIVPGSCRPYQVASLQTITFSETIPPEQAQAIFSTSWAGSDVVMTLVAPSGRVIDRNTVAPDVVHDLGSTFETYSIIAPEAGQWQVSLFGADVPPEGEEVIFGLTTVPAETPTCQPSNSLSSIRGMSSSMSQESLAFSSVTNFQQLPLSFIPNQGQADQEVRFHVEGLGGSLFFAPREVVFSLPNPKRVPAEDDDGRQEIRFDLLPPSVVRIHYLGANPAPQLTGTGRLPGVVNYLRGNDPAKWLTNLPTYSGVAYRELYPGIELRYQGTEGQLKSLFNITPGADPAAIRWRYNGATGVYVDEEGNLVISLPAPAEGSQGASLIEHSPVAWQQAGEQRIAVAVHYQVDPGGNVQFSFPEGYDPSLPLTIDPVLEYSTYLGGGKAEEGNAITLDGECNAYLAGSTFSNDFPTANPIQVNPPGRDAFISKLNPSGDALLYSTYLGGNGNDATWGIALDGTGNIVIAGETESSDFPTANAFDATYGGGTCGDGPCDDVFVTQLSADGSAILYSTYLGGGGDEAASAVAAGPGGKIYLAGDTYSTNFPTANAYDNTFGGGTCGDKPCADAFVTVLDPALSGAESLRYSTYLGDNKYDTGKGIAVDANGHAYVTGYTQSNNFPTRNPYQASRAGSSDVFVVKVDANQSGSASLLYGTYLGGSGSDNAYGLALGGVDRVYLTGFTNSADFPTANAFDSTLGGGVCGSSACPDAFASRLDLSTNSLVYSTYLGGSAGERGLGIAVDGSGSAYLTGFTQSDDFPVSSAVQPTRGADQCSGLPCADAFVTKLSPSGSVLVYSTYLGGGGEDYGNGIVLDGAGGAYLTGYTLSSDFPTTPGAYDTTISSTYEDSFVVKIGE